MRAGCDGVSVAGSWSRSWLVLTGDDAAHGARAGVAVRSERGDADDAEQSGRRVRRHPHGHRLAGGGRSAAATRSGDMHVVARVNRCTWHVDGADTTIADRVEVQVVSASTSGLLGKIRCML